MSVKRGLGFQSVCFTVEGLNSFSTVLFSYYLYFYLRSRFNFHDRDNLLVAALLGLVYLVLAWQGGRFAQRRGNFMSVKLGLALMMTALAAGSQLNSVLGLLLVAVVFTAGQCFTWPALEALVSESEAPDRLPHAVGIYNVTWAVTAAVSYFIGGTLIQMSSKNIFFVPLIVQAVELGLVFWLQNHVTELVRAAGNPSHVSPPPDPNRPSPAKAKTFLHMAWLANPFAYIAINTLIAVVPGIAAKFQFTPMFAGFVCSLWCFARMGAFAVLWIWTAWHYRFRWLLAAYLTLIAAFAAVLTAPNLAVLVVAQILFGGAVGLIYYSSLFYSMDAGDTKGEHGGIHEAVIGAGNCVGPAAGATALWMAPGRMDIGAWAVSGLLTVGLGALLWIRSQTAKK